MSHGKITAVLKMGKSNYEYSIDTTYYAIAPIALAFCSNGKSNTVTIHHEGRCPWMQNLPSTRTGRLKFGDVAASDGN